GKATKVAVSSACSTNIEASSPSSEGRRTAVSEERRTGGRGAAAGNAGGASGSATSTSAETPASTAASQNSARTSKTAAIAGPATRARRNEAPTPTPRIAM